MNSSHRLEGFKRFRSPRVVLLHGITGSQRFFGQLVARLNDFPVRAETCSFDLLGFGTNKGVHSCFGCSDQLEHITLSIATRFPSGPLVLIGHSLGGVLALAWAAQHADRVSRLVLLNTPLGQSRDDTVRSLLRGGLGWASLMLKHPHLAHLACVTLRSTHLIRAFRFLKPSYVSDDVFNDYGQHTWDSLIRTFDQVVLGIPGGPLIKQLHTMPILNLTGQEDEDISKRSVDQSNVQNVTLRGGHLMLLQHPESTSCAIEKFLVKSCGP